MYISKCLIIVIKIHEDDRFESYIKKTAMVNSLISLNVNILFAISRGSVWAR